MKDSKKSFRVGDKIIDFGQVCRIFEVRKKKNKKGEEERVIFFRPYFKTKLNKSYICSIPVKNIEKAKIRKPVSKTELGKILRKMTEKPKKDPPINIVKLRDKLKLNSFQETTQVLKKLWLDKNDGSTNLTGTKKRVFDMAMKRFTEEMALLTNTTPKQAKEKIKRRLEKLTDHN